MKVIPFEEVAKKPYAHKMVYLLPFTYQSSLMNPPFRLDNMEQVAILLKRQGEELPEAGSITRHAQTDNRIPYSIASNEWVDATTKAT